MGQLLCCYKKNRTIRVKKINLSNKIAPKFNYNIDCKYSKKSIEWLNYVADNMEIFIRHAENVGELIIKDDITGRTYYVDGFCEETETVYEFHGDFWHGNPMFYNQNDFSNKLGKTFGEAYRDTLQREEAIRRKYKLIVIWEYQWDALKFHLQI
jgi:hypothetical protein